MELKYFTLVKTDRLVHSGQWTLHFYHRYQSIFYAINIFKEKNWKSDLLSISPISKCNATLMLAHTDKWLTAMQYLLPAAFHKSLLLATNCWIWNNSAHEQELAHAIVQCKYWIFTPDVSCQPFTPSSLLFSVYLLFCGVY